MSPRRRMGISTLTVLQAIASSHRYGFEIIEATDLPGGTVYPALAKLESDGHLRSSWEDPEIAREEGRPPRRYYEITRSGERALERAIAPLRGLLQAEAPETPEPEAATGEEA